MEAIESRLCPTAILVDLNFSGNSGNKINFSMSDILHLSDIMGDASHCSALSGLEMDNLTNGEEKLCDFQNLPLEDDFQNLPLEDEIENEKFEFHLSGLPEILEESSKNDSKNELDENSNYGWNPEIAKEANKISRRLSLPQNQLMSKLMAFSPILGSLAMTDSERSSSLSSNKFSQSSLCLGLESASVIISEKENDSAFANRQTQVRRNVKCFSTSTDSDSSVFYTPIEEALQSSPYLTTDSLKIQLDESRDKLVNEMLKLTSVPNNQNIPETNNSKLSPFRKFTYTVEAHKLLNDLERPVISEPVLKEDTKQHSLCRVPPIRKDTYLVEDKLNERVRHLSGPSQVKDPKTTKPQITKSKSFNDPSRVRNSGGAKAFSKPSVAPVRKPSVAPPSKPSLQTARTAINSNTRSTIAQNSGRNVAPKGKPGPIKASLNFPAPTQKIPIRDTQPPSTAPTTPAKTSTTAAKQSFSTPQKNNQSISTPSRQSMLPPSSFHSSSAKLSTPDRRSMVPSTSSNWINNQFSTPNRRSMVPSTSSNSINNQFSTPNRRSMVPSTSSNSINNQFSTPNRRSMAPITPITPTRLPTPIPGRRKSIPVGLAASKAKWPGKIEVPIGDCKAISRLQSPSRKAKR